MFENAKPGDKVWHNRKGWIEIVEVHKNEDYPILTCYGAYTFCGRYDIKHVMPTIYWNEFEIPKEAFIKPLPKLEVDTKVIVWNNTEFKKNRHFSHFDKLGNICCFLDGGTSWTETGVKTWTNWELADE